MKRLWAFIGILFGLQACEELAEITDVAPFTAASVRIIEIDPFSLTVTAEITNLGDGLEEYGIVYSTVSTSPRLGDSNSLTANVSTDLPSNAPGIFTASLDPSLIPSGSTAYVVAYARDVHRDVPVYGQVVSFTKSITFVKTYGSYQFGQRVIVTNDQGYAISGRISGSSGLNIFLVRANESGEFSDGFEQTYAFSPSDNIGGLTQFGDQFLLGGSTFNSTDNTFDAFIFGVNSSNGVMSGPASYVRTTGFTEIGRRITVGTGGFPTLVGSTNLQGAHRDVLIVVFTAGLSRRFQETIAFGEDAVGNDIIPSASGGFAVTGSISSPVGRKALFFETNAEGKLSGSAITYGNNGNYQANSMVALDAGGYMICGSVVNNADGNEDFLLLKIDNSGQVTDLSYGGSESEFAFDIILLDDNSLVLVGAKEENAYMAKLNQSGDLIWQRDRWGINNTALVGFDFFNSVSSTPDGGFIASGGSLGELLLVKTDNTGVVSQ